MKKVHSRFFYPKQIDYIYTIIKTNYIMFRIFKKKPKFKFVPKKYVIYNVDTFNHWFNDKFNNAEYANSGIYLRLDKLDRAQIYDYLIKCHNLDLNEYGDEQELIEFEAQIRRNWLTTLTHEEEL